MSRTFLCPHCGWEVDAKVTACPNCGSDKDTGWSQNPAEAGRFDEEDYREAVEREFCPASRTLKTRDIIYGIAACVLLALFLLYIIK